MSNISYIEKLLDGVEVEWKPLGEVARFINGRAYKKPELLEQGKYPVLRVGNFFTNENWYYSDLELDEDKYCDNGDLLYAWSASFGPRIWEGGKVIYHYHIWKVIPNVNQVLKKFLFYLLEWDTKALQGEHATGSTMMHVSKGAIESRLVPIPCPDNPEKSLAIQAEIVRILDAFTAMTAELTAELNMRKKQYNYYRDQLLSFEEGDVEWKTLGDENFFEVGSGGTPSKSKPEYWDDGNIPWLKSESCNNEPVYFANNFITELGLSKSSAKLLQKKTTLIALVGATIFKTAFLEFPAATNQNIASIKSKKPEAVSDKFVFYYITNLYEVLKSEMRNYGMLNLTTLRQFRIPIPHPEEQARIVAILDKFDALTNSITEGLPREIELRQKQYEYYRDLLLSFPKPEEAAA